MEKLIIIDITLAEIQSNSSEISQSFHFFSLNLYVRESKTNFKLP